MEAVSVDDLFPESETFAAHHVVVAVSRPEERRAMEQSRPKYISSCSFGKDSIATILLALQHEEPLDEVVYCEVMFDSETSGEIPEHRDFIYNVAIPFIEREGIPVVVVRPEKTMKDFFYQERGVKSKYCGKMLGFPMVGRCELNGSAKIKAIRRYWKKQPQGSMRYIGIAADEPRRLERMKPNSISLLQAYNVTEKEAFEICKKRGLLSPIYQFTTRSGCFFCPNAGESALRHLRVYHPALWEELLNMSQAENIIRKDFRVGESLLEIEERFLFEDSQISLF